jgi:hypothetical protein
MTAGQIVAVPAQRVPHRRPADLGDAEGPSVMVNAETLASMLRRLVPSNADVVPGAGWWTLRCFGDRIVVGGEDFDQLGTRAVSALRQFINEVDPDRRTASPLVWLVRLSSDRDLRAWLNIPTPPEPAAEPDA